MHGDVPVDNAHVVLHEAAKIAFLDTFSDDGEQGVPAVIGKQMGSVEVDSPRRRFAAGFAPAKRGGDVFDQIASNLLAGLQPDPNAPMTCVVAAPL